MTHSFPSQLVNNWLDRVLRPLDSIVNYQGRTTAVKKGFFLTKLVRKGKKDQYSNYIKIRFVGRISVRFNLLFKRKVAGSSPVRLPGAAKAGHWEVVYPSLGTCF